MVASYRAKFLWGTLSMAGLILASAFSGLTIAKMLVKGPSRQIQTLEDIVKMPQMMIYVKESTFMHSFMQQQTDSSDLHPELKSKILAVALERLEVKRTVFESVAKGEAVLVDFNLNIVHYLQVSTNIIIRSWEN